MFLFSFRRMYMFNSQDAYVYFLRIPPCILNACMIKSIWNVTWSCYISFPFSLFFIFLLCFSTRKTFLWKTSALNIHSTVLLIGILLMSFSISLNKKELYEKHVQNLNSNRKGSDKLYQGSYKINPLPSAFSWEAILENLIDIAECLFQTWVFWKTSPLKVLCHQWHGLELELYGGHHL